MFKFILLVWLMVPTAWSQTESETPPEGLKWIASQRGFDQTWARLQQGSNRRGLQVVYQARFDTAAARGSLRATGSISISNRRMDARLLQCAQSLAAELPIRVGVWQAATGRVYLAYPDIHALLERHGARVCAGKTGEALSINLEAAVHFAAR